MAFFYKVIEYAIIILALKLSIILWKISNFDINKAILKK